jgi:hypothetical protein
MFTLTLKLQGIKAVSDPNMVMLSLARAPIGGGSPELSVAVYKTSPLGQLPLGATIRVRLEAMTES